MEKLCGYYLLVPCATPYRILEIHVSEYSGPVYLAPCAVLISWTARWTCSSADWLWQKPKWCHGLTSLSRIMFILERATFSKPLKRSLIRRYDPGSCVSFPGFGIFRCLFQAFRYHNDIGYFPKDWECSTRSIPLKRFIRIRKHTLDGSFNSFRKFPSSEMLWITFLLVSLIGLGLVQVESW